MSFLTNFWNTAAEYFRGPAKYLEDNNINTVTLGNFATDLAVIGAGIGEKTAEAVQQAAHNAAGAIVNSPATIHEWAGKAGTFMADTGYKGLQGTHGWYFGKTAEENAQESSAAMLKELAVNMPHDGLKNTHDWYFGKTSADEQQSSAAMLKALAVNVPYDALKNTHEWHFGKAADAAPQGGVTMAVDLAGAAGSKVLDIVHSAVTSAYNWYFNSPAKDAADQPKPKGGDALPAPAAGDTAVTPAADLCMDKDQANAPVSPTALPAANTSDDAAQQPPVASIQVKELVPTSSLIQSPDDIVSTEGFIDNQDHDAALACAGHDLSSSSDEHLTDHAFTEYFDDASMMGNHLAMSQAMTTVSVY